MEFHKVVSWARYYSYYIYINNSICDLKIDGQITTYADDTCLLFSGVSWKDVRSKATKGFKKVINYLNHRKLSINYNKTNFINFSINEEENNNDDLKLCFCGNGDNCNNNMCHEIYTVSSIRYLGLIFDNNMRRNLRVKTIVMRMRTLSFCFFKLRNFLPVNVMRIIYLSLFQAIFQYGLLVRGGLNENAVRPLILFQRKIIRICLGRNNLIGSTGDNFKVSNVLPVESVYKKVSIMYIIKNYEHFFVVENIRKKRELMVFDVKVFYCKKTFGQHFIDYLSPNYYNAMPLHIKKTRPLLYWES